MRSSWGGAKEKYNKNDSFVALDFFPDVPKIGGTEDNKEEDDSDYWFNNGMSTMTDDQLGVAVHLTKASKEGTCVDQEKDASISLLKASSTSMYMIIGIVFIILGMLMLLMGFLKKKSPDKTKIAPVE